MLHSLRRWDHFLLGGGRGVKKRKKNNVVGKRRGRGLQATQVHLFIYFDSFPLLCALNENSFPFDVVRLVVSPSLSLSVTHTLVARTYAYVTRRADRAQLRALFCSLTHWLSLSFSQCVSLSLSLLPCVFGCCCAIMKKYNAPK